MPFNPAVKDGRGTRGLAVPKSNWANLIDTPPFEAYAVTCGLTFTFGGLKITTSGEVESTDGSVIPGLFAAGELVGGLFYHNYPAARAWSQARCWASSPAMAPVVTFPERTRSTHA